MGNRLASSVAPAGSASKSLSKDSFDISKHLSHASKPSNHSFRFATAGDEAPSPGALGTPSTSPTWAVSGQERKAGAGVLFFAYGGQQLSHFLAEAVSAARSLRRHNPAMALAVVTNNQTVDRSLFAHHIKPRPDLLFQGSPCPYGPKSCRKDAMPRQWLTRLYYLAHSPFLLTWALDSNVVSCTPGAGAFLDAAFKSNLWGFDIAHANQAQGMCRMEPHSNACMPSLNLRRGVTTDDQGTLFAAEQRARATGGLKVGQMPTGFAAAFYSPTGNFYPRITRVILGPAVIIHSKPKMANRFCKDFNFKSSRRQLWMPNAETVASFETVAQCRRVLHTKKCPFAGEGPRSLGSVVFEPKATKSPQTLKLAW